MKAYNILIISLSAGLILLNFLLLFQFGPEVHRWGRVISSSVFLAVFLKDYHPKKIFLTGAFILLVTADVFALSYQNVLPQQAFFILHSLTYFLLLFHIGRYLIKPRLIRYQKIYFSFVFLLNTFFVVILGDLLAEEVRDSIVQILFYVYGLFAILFISGSILYYDKFPNGLSTSFLLVVAGLVLSNLMGFPAHFMKFAEFFYLDRLLYVIGLSGLVFYSYYSGQILCKEKNNGSSEDYESKRLTAQQVIDQHIEEHNYL